MCVFLTKHLRFSALLADYKALLADDRAGLAGSQSRFFGPLFTGTHTPGRKSTVSSYSTTEEGGRLLHFLGLGALRLSLQRACV